MDNVLNKKDWFSTEEAAAELGLDQRTVIKYIGRGLIKARKFSGVWAIPRSEITRYNKERRNPGNPNFGKANEKSQRAAN